MRIVSVKDFKNHATALIRDEIEEGRMVVLTKRKKPIALIKPFMGEEKEALIGYLMSEIGNLFKQVDISETEALEALDKARKEIYDNSKSG